VNSIIKYFKTDWHALTGTDWIGLIITIIITLLMIGLYIYVFRPKNREMFEAHRHIIMKEDDLNGNG
jgi:cytochrome c oxidase cbb3-type subunit IV